MQKIYNYTDESGQDTKGKFFVVTNVVIARGRDGLEKFLLEAEEKSGRGIRKWHSSRLSRRQRYLGLIINSGTLKNKIFCRIYAGGYSYLDRTSYTIADSLDKFAEANNINKYQGVIVVDGAKPTEQRRIGSIIRRRGIFVAKVRGARDESNTLIRLADSMAGLVRDAHLGDEYSQTMVAKLKREGIINDI